MQDAPVGEDKQGLFERIKYRAGQELFDKRNRGTPDSDLQDFFARLKKRREESEFAEQFSLMPFDSSLVNTLMIGKRRRCIDRQAIKLLGFAPDRERCRYRLLRGEVQYFI
jgi:hypothetical protein